ncbi:MAG: sulfotransferase domain-containing protein [Paracoccaceae bacterium]
MQDLRRIVWLASFPKSGNTWIRALLANYILSDRPDINSLHRFSTADVRQDFFDRVTGRPFRAKDIKEWLRVRAKVLPAIAASKPGHHFVKTHSKVGRLLGYPLIMPEVTAAAIYVMRNPFDVLSSYARHMNCPIDTALERMTHKDNMQASDTGIVEVLGSWDGHVASWISAKGLHPHVIRYEDLLSDADAEMRRLIAFLGMKADEDALSRALDAASFDSLQSQEQARGFRERPAGMKQFFATGTSGGWRQALTPDQIGRVRAAFLSTLKQFYPEMLDETSVLSATKK